MKGWVIFDRIIDLLAALAGTILIFIMLAVCVDVIAKDLLRHTLTWVLEFSGYSILYITFLGTAWTLKAGGHVIIDIGLNRLNPKNQALVNIITSVLSAITCLLLMGFAAYTSWDHFHRGLYQCTMVEPPDIALYPVIPLGFALLVIQFLRRAYSSIRDLRMPKFKNNL